MKSIGLLLPFLASAALTLGATTATPAPDDALASAIQAAVNVPPTPPAAAPQLTPTPVPALKIVPPPAVPVRAPVGPGPQIAPPTPFPSTPVPAAVVPVVPGGSNHVFEAAGKPDDAHSVVEQLKPGAAADLSIDELVRERARIRLYGDYSADFRGASLGSVAEALATFAQMSFVSPGPDVLNTSINISGKKNILDLFDTLTANYGLAMVYSRGIWIFGKKSNDTMVLRSYVIHFDNRGEADITSPTIGSTTGSTNGAGTGTNGTSSNNNNSGSSLSGSTQGNIKVKYDDLTKIITEVLKTPYPTSNGIQVTANAAPSVPNGTATFLPEHNELVVYASEFHQGLVKDYLSKIDQPLNQIEFAATFVETSNDPTQNLGVSWTPAASVTIGGQNSGNSFKIPMAGIVSSYQLASALSFAAQDSFSSVEQNPTVVGLTNRKTVLDASRQIPVASSTFNTGSSTTAAGSTNTQIQYIDVGTIVTVYPEVMTDPDGYKVIRMNVSLVVSNIIGSTTIGGNPTPLTSTRRFEFTSDVPDGQSLIIGGLVGNSVTYSNTKLPFLGDVPYLGQLFRADNDSASRSQLMVYITPHILRRGENAALHILSRTWPEDPGFSRPYFTAAKASPAYLQASLDGFDRELDAVKVYIEQRRDPVALKSRISELHEEAKVMKAYVEVLKKKKVVLDPTLITTLNSDYSRASALRTDIYTNLKL